MKQFIGTKILLAVAMTLGAYNDFKGWAIPADEDPEREGYKVEYADGYISWSPKEVFDESYRPTDDMNFGLAVEAAKIGHAIARRGWNGANMFAYIVPAGSYDPVTEIAQKAFFGHKVPYRQYWALKTAQDDVATWAPSGSDTLADDWFIVDLDLIKFTHDM